MLIGIDASPAARQNRTGIEWYTFHIIQGLLSQEDGNQYRLYTDKAFQVDQYFFKNHTQVLRWPFPYFWSEGRLSLEMLKSRPDVLFVPGRSLPLSLPARTVTTIHDLGFARYAHERSYPSQAYLAWSTSHAVKSASHILTISQFTKNELIEKYKIDDSRITVSPLGFDASMYVSHPQAHDSDILRKHNLQKPFLLSVSRIDHRKNILFLLSVFEKLHATHPDLELVLAGPLGYGGKEIITHIDNSKCRDAVRYLGWISETEKSALLRSATCMVFPSLYEGFGLPVIESQASGTPVVCSDATALPEIAGDGALYFDPSDEDSALSALQRSITDIQLRNALRVRGFENCKKYSWQHTVEVTRKALLSV